MGKNIVILGAGFGGVRCALEVDRALTAHAREIPRFRPSASARDDKEGWRVILVDRQAYHLYSPRLYEEIIPSGRDRHGPAMAWPRDDGAGRCSIDVREILKGTKVEFVEGEVKGIECKGRVVEIATPHQGGARNDIKFDYLVLALGAGTDYFGIEGLEKYACTLKSLEDARVIKEKIREFLKYAEAGPPGTRRPGLPFSIVIGGAGATGVEVAAELAYLFRGVPKGLWSVTLVEALSSVLWMFPKAVGEYAYKRLNKLGVHVMLDTCIKRADRAHSREIATLSRGRGTPRNDERGVEVVLAPRPFKPGETEAELACDFLPEHEKRIGADLLLWAGGVRSNPLLTQCGLTLDRKGRIEVDEHLSVKGLEGVFGIGDNATLLDPNTKQPVPATAQAALLQGKVVAENIVRLIRGGKASGAPEALPLVSYTFPKFPAIVPLANRDGVALLGDRVWRGFPAWLLRQAADLRYYMSILPFGKAVYRCFL